MTITTGLHSADGSKRVTVVSGSSYTGLYAADGSLNVVKSSGSSLIGAYHPCGALNETKVTSGLKGKSAADGSRNMSASPGLLDTEQVTVISGIL